MKCKRFAKNATVWSLIAALSNPALMVPAVYGRDTDIFLGITTSLTTAEPNILIILDTSDSMNTYEGWREYDLRDALGAPKYDSHIEYLWNDPTYINTITAVTPDATFSNVGSSPTGYFVTYAGGCPSAANPNCPRDSGVFAGTTDALRAALKTQALAHAAATEPGDPGARSVYRNYNDASWLYWLPTGTAESDNRLRSYSFNRFIGGIRVSNFSSTNGTTNPVVRGGFSYGNNRDFTVGSALRTSANTLNRCTASMADLLPSTVYAPSELPRNTGKSINQQWQRWERWLSLENSRASAYPGSHGTVAYSSGTYRIGTAGTGYDDSAAATTTFPGVTDNAVNGPASASHGVGATPPVPGFTASRDDTGTNGSLGLPIRVQLDIAPNGVSHASDSHAGWTDLKADLGGFIFHGVAPPAGVVDQSVNALPLARLTELRGIYGYALLSAAGASATENERFSAWKGNRDVGATAFGMVTGTHAYYDIRPTVNVGGVLRDVINNVSGVIPGVTCTRSCGVLATGADGPNAAGLDGSNNNRTFYRDGTGGLYCRPDGGALSGTCAPAAGGAAVPNCTPTADTGFVIRNHTGCAWTGRSSKFVEGVGTVFYGGTCSGSCRGAGFVLGAPGCPSGPTSTSYCTPASAGTEGANWIGNFTVDGTAYTNVTKNVIGTCSDIGDTAQNCSTHRPGDAPCLYGPSTVAAFCPPRSNTTAATGGTTTRYPSYRGGNVGAQRELNLIHDCKADEPANNGGANVFMTKQKRNFDQTFNTTVATVGTVAAYTTSAADAIAPPAIDLYSVNYLNWKYGAKSASAIPIGRKTRLQIAKDALNDLIAVTDGVRFGLETFNALPNDFPLRGTQGSQGGKIVFPVKRMGSNAADADFVNRAALTNVINNELARAATPLTESLYEAYLYLSGRAPRFGTSGAITANFGATALPAVGGGNVTDGADATAISAGNYVSPMLNNPTVTTPSSCQKNFVILITDGGPEKDLGASSQIQPLRYTNSAGDIYSPDTNVDTTEPNTASGQFETGTPSLPYGPKDLVDNTSYVWLDELAYFMSRADMSPGAPHLTTETTTDSLTGTQVVVTYTIGFAGAASPVLENAAAKAGGAYYIAEDSAELAAALTDAIIKIRDWDPTVAAPTVPLSALNRSQNALDIYLAFFAPATTQTWKGTVKRFRIGIGTTDCGPDKELCLIGKTVLPSGTKDIEKLEFDAATGFSQVVVDPDAVSFWNPVTLKDGSEPDQGGTGYQTLSVGGYTPATRNVYTFISSGATSAALANTTNLVSEDNARITKTILGNAAMSDAARSTLINYIRGGNTGDAACNDATSATACTTWRTWAHNDVQHSRPVIVTYNSTPTPDAEAPGSDRATVQYLFYLTNDGLVHAVDASNGREKWVFLIEEALPKINAVMANAGGPSHDLADGTPVAWVDRGDADGLVDGSERVWLFFGLRRGGRAYYALDITNIDAPQFKWRITPTERCVAVACGATADFAQLGQSWSTPVVGRVSATTGASGARPAGNVDPVVMFGGGYDPQQDTHPLPAGTTSDTMGKAVFIVEGSNAALVKSFTNVGSDFVTATSIDWSIPSDLTVVDINQDAQGLLDRIVVGDVGGNVWRFDVSASDATAWKGKKIAALSDPGVPNRKILFAPVIVPQKDPFPVPWHAVYVGTGDREHPLVTTSSDKIFMIVDFDTGLSATAGPPASFSGGDLLSLTLADTGGVLPAALVTKRGWYRDLEAGEKVTGPPFVINQKLRFGSYNPSAVISACLPPGEGRLNEVSALYGDLIDLSGDGVISGRDRYYAGVSRGFFSPLQTVIIGGSVFTISIAGGSVTTTTTATPPPPGSTGVCATGSMFWTCREQRVGIAQRVYWYMEPEQ